MIWLCLRPLLPLAGCFLGAWLLIRVCSILWKCHTRMKKGL